MSKQDQKTKTRAMVDAAKAWEKSPNDENFLKFLQCKSAAGVGVDAGGLIGKNLQMKLKTAITAFEKKPQKTTTHTKQEAPVPA